MFLRNQKNLVSEEVNQLIFFFFYVLMTLDIVRTIIATIRLTDNSEAPQVKDVHINMNILQNYIR